MGGPPGARSARSVLMRSGRLSGRKRSGRSNGMVYFRATKGSSIIWEKYEVSGHIGGRYSYRTSKLHEANGSDAARRPQSALLSSSRGMAIQKEPYVSRSPCHWASHWMPVNTCLDTCGKNTLATQFGKLSKRKSPTPNCCQVRMRS